MFYKNDRETNLKLCRSTGEKIYFRGHGRDIFLI